MKMLLAGLLGLLISAPAVAQDYIHAPPVYQKGSPTYPTELKTTGCLAVNPAGSVLEANCTDADVRANTTLIVTKLVYKKTEIGTGTGSLGVYVSSQIPFTSSYQTVISSGLGVVLITTPSISTSTALGGTTLLTDGTILVLSSTSTASSVTLQDAGTLSGSQLQLGAATRLIDALNTLTLIWDSKDGFWREISYGSN